MTHTALYCRHLDNQRGVGHKPEDAATAFRLGATQGCGASCNGLAKCYELGYGVAKDLHKALALLKYASQVGGAKAHLHERARIEKLLGPEESEKVQPSCSV